MRMSNAMKITSAAALCGAVAMISGCATQNASRAVQPQDLRTSSRFITERVIGEMDFPTLQRNLFQHRAACGEAPRFVMHEGETGRASLVDSADLPQSYDDVVLMDLVQYPDSYRSPKRVVIRAYSYYINSDVKRRVENMLNAIQLPGQCLIDQGN